MVAPLANRSQVAFGVALRASRHTSAALAAFEHFRRAAAVVFGAARTAFTTRRNATLLLQLLNQTLHTCCRWCCGERLFPFSLFLFCVLDFFARAALFSQVRRAARFAGGSGRNVVRRRALWSLTPQVRAEVNAMSSGF